MCHGDTKWILTVSVTLIQESELLSSIIDEKKGEVMNCLDELGCNYIIALLYTDSADSAECFTGLFYFFEVSF